MNIVARSGNSKRSFVLLAPPGSTLGPFSEVNVNLDLHSELLSQMQRLRGRIYLQDGALQPSDLTSDGKHISSIDNESWHLLTMNAEGRVLGCARFHQHPRSATYQDLNVRHASLARSPEWGAAVREAIEREMEFTRSASFFWLEMGGWALAEELRGTTEALLYALASYAWSQLMGGAIGISTVTERNGSAFILKRLGGQSLQWRGSPLPAYYDEQYRCTMELLRFDSRFPAPKYLSSIESLRCEIANTPVICAQKSPDWQSNIPISAIPTQLAGPWTAIAAAS